MRVACFVEGLLLSCVGYLEVLFHTFYNHCTEEDRSQNKNLHYCKFSMWKRQCMIKIQLLQKGATCRVTLRLGTTKRRGYLPGH